MFLPLIFNTSRFVRVRRWSIRESNSMPSKPRRLHSKSISNKLWFSSKNGFSTFKVPAKLKGQCCRDRFLIHLLCLRPHCTMTPQAFPVRNAHVLFLPRHDHQQWERKKHKLFQEKCSCQRTAPAPSRRPLVSRRLSPLDVKATLFQAIYQDELWAQSAEDHCSWCSLNWILFSCPGSFCWVTRWGDTRWWHRYNSEFVIVW